MLDKQLERPSSARVDHRRHRHCQSCAMSGCVPSECDAPWAPYTVDVQFRNDYQSPRPFHRPAGRLRYFCFCWGIDWSTHWNVSFFVFVYIFVRKWTQLSQEARKMTEQERHRSEIYTDIVRQSILWKKGTELVGLCVSGTRKINEFLKNISD